MSVRSREVAEKINQESGGRVDVSFFPNGTLGSSVDLLKQVRLGAIQFALIGDNIVQTVGRLRKRASTRSQSVGSPGCGRSSTRFDR
jgi:hypothetical protein